jgi:hypothetical protein
MHAARMLERNPSLAPAATGLVIANVVMIGVAIACLFFARRAWSLREEAVAALGEARAATAPTLGRPLVATVHARVARLRVATLDRMLVFGVVGITGSAFFTWRLVTRSARARRPRTGKRPGPVRDR